MVKVAVNSDTGAVVTAFPNNPTFGYVQLESEQTVFQNGWIKKKKRSTLMRGETQTLKSMFVAGQELEGKIVVTECLEDNIPAQQAQQLDKTKDFEAQISYFLKRAGSQDAPILKKEGKRILRFTDYDESGSLPDTRVAHDNTEEVKAYNLAQASGGANLPE